MPVEPTTFCDAGSCNFSDVSNYPSIDSSTLDVVETSSSITGAVSEENWEFTLSGFHWNRMDISTPGIKAGFDNLNNSCKILLIKESTQNTFSEYVISSIRGLSAGTSGSLQSAYQVIVNGNKFILAHIKKDNVVVWAWITQKSSFGYVFTCGGEMHSDSGNEIEEICASTAATFKIK